MKMSTKTKNGGSTTVGFRCDEEMKEELQKKIVKLQHEGRLPLDAKKSDVLRELADMWLKGEIEVEEDDLD